MRRVVFGEGFEMKVMYDHLVAASERSLVDNFETYLPAKSNVCEQVIMVSLMETRFNICKIHDGSNLQKGYVNARVICTMMSRCACVMERSPGSVEGSSPLTTFR